METETKIAPLGFERAGEPIELAPDAEWFRVMLARPGQPCVVQDREAGGGPLFVPLSTTAAELRRRSGPGCFTLVQLDEDLNPIKDAERGYVELAEPEPRREADPDPVGAQPLPDPLRTLLDAVLKSQDQNRETLREVSASLVSIAKVNTDAMEMLARLASGQPIREVEVHHPTVIDSSAEQKDSVRQALETFGPLIAQVTPLLVAWARKKVTDGELPPAAQLVPGVTP